VYADVGVRLCTARRVGRYKVRRGHAPGEPQAPTRRKRKDPERALKALDRRIAGATYAQIGQQLGVSEKTAYVDIQDKLGRLHAVMKKKAERLRDLESRRLDSLQVALGRGMYPPSWPHCGRLTTGDAH